MPMDKAPLKLLTWKTLFLQMLASDYRSEVHDLPDNIPYRWSSLNVSMQEDLTLCLKGECLFWIGCFPEIFVLLQSHF